MGVSAISRGGVESTPPQCTGGDLDPVANRVKVNLTLFRLLNYSDSIKVTLVSDDQNAIRLSTLSLDYQPGV